MTALPLRRIAFAFDERTPFQWNRRNPHFGLIGNTVSFFAQPFERYMVAAMRDARPRIADPAIREEAEAFLRQEAQHARIHRLHVDALIGQYPALQQTLDAMQASYDALYASESLEFHLAYAANIEATFAPLFGTWLEHPAELFDNGDPPVAALFLWHFVEEIEHRASAFRVYNAVVPSRLYRLRQLPRVMRHIREVGDILNAGINQHVPLAERLVDAGSRDVAAAFASIPARARRRMNLRLLLSQWPYHDPDRERVPPIAARWLQAYDEGRDVENWYAPAAP